MRENPGAGWTRDQWLTALRRRAEHPEGFRGLSAAGTDRRERIAWRVRAIIGGDPADADRHMESYDWDGEAEAGFDAADERENLGTSFSDWHWDSTAVRRDRLGPRRTRYTKQYTGTRIRIEVRRELRDARGAPVRPDLDNIDHYGESSP